MPPLNFGPEVQYFDKKLWFLVFVVIQKQVKYIFFPRTMSLVELSMSLVVDLFVGNLQKC